MTNSKLLYVFFFVALTFCDAKKTPEVISLTDSSLSEVFDQLAEKTNPFEFYNSVYENFRFELKSTLIQSGRAENEPPLESVTIFEINENDENRFFKKSLEPISEVEWIEKEGKDFIRYDDAKHFLRTSYNPVFEKWKKGIFQDIRSTFDLETLEKQSPNKEQNMWSCYEEQKEKLCVDSKTGLPVFGKTIKQLNPETAISMVFSLGYGQSVTSEKESVKTAPPKSVPKKQTLQKKK